MPYRTWWGSGCRLCGRSPPDAKRWQAAATVMDGMVVKALSQATGWRMPGTALSEFLLINHPLDCPIYQAGECHLQTWGMNMAKKAPLPICAPYILKFDDLAPSSYMATRCISATVVLMWQIRSPTNGRMALLTVAIMRRSPHISKAIDNDFSGNMIDVCPVGALTDKTFRFKTGYGFTKPVDAHRDCQTPGCCGKATLWLQGDEVFRLQPERSMGRSAKLRR